MKAFVVVETLGQRPKIHSGVISKRKISSRLVAGPVIIDCCGVISSGCAAGAFSDIGLKARVAAERSRCGFVFSSDLLCGVEEERRNGRLIRPAVTAPSSVRCKIIVHLVERRQP